MAARRSGQIRPKGERRWLVRWYDSGKYLSKMIHGTKRDAQKYLNARLAGKDLGIHVAPSKLTLNQFLDRWEEHVKQQVAASTFESYRTLLKRHVRADLGGNRLDSIRTTDIQDHMDRLATRARHRPKRRRTGGSNESEPKTLSPRTVTIIRSILNAALKKACKWDLIARNPAEDVDLPPQVKREAVYLDTDQIRTFREAAKGERHAVLFDFLLGTGCRPGEARACQWGDIDFKEGRVTIRRSLTKVRGKQTFTSPKTDRSLRLIPLPPTVVQALREHRRAQATQVLKLGPDYARDLDLVFPNELGLPLDGKNLLVNHLRPILKRAGIKLKDQDGKEVEATLYSLRHSYATAALEAGVPSKVTQVRLGHSTSRTTEDTYSHVTPPLQEEATARIEETLFGA